MATRYRLKRKIYSNRDIINSLLEKAFSDGYNFAQREFGALGEVTGSAMQGVGNVMNNGMVSTGAGIATAATAGSALGDTLSAAGVPGGGLIGMGVGYLGGKKLTQSLGKGIKNAGGDMRAEASLG